MKKSKCKLLQTLFIATMAVLLSHAMGGTTYSSVQAATIIKNTRVEQLKNPIGVDASNPRFSWEMASDKRGSVQTAYQIKVSTDQAGLNEVWNSGKVLSDQSNNVKCASGVLLPSTRYYWWVDVWDNTNAKVSSTENAFFETGLLNSGWSGAQWIKMGETGDDGIVNYSVSVKFEIKDLAAGFFFAAKDIDNCFMWQINLEKQNVSGRSTFRPHSWKNANGTNHEDKDITDLIKIYKDIEYTMRIDIVGDNAKTYINNILIDDRQNPRGGNYGFGNFGFRQYQGERPGAGWEDAYFDDVKATTIVNGSPIELFSADFSDAAKPQFTGGTVVAGRYHVVGGTNGNVGTAAFQASSVQNPITFTLDLDMTLIKDNAGIIFGASDASNMHMWSVNTLDNAYPILRRHIYTNGNAAVQDIRLPSSFTNANIKGTERHVKIDVKDNEIKTYIDGVLIDTYLSPTLKTGFVGFRAFKSNNVDEHAYYDNIVLTSYTADASNVLQATVTFSEDFENGKNDFDGTKTITIDGNTKLDMFSTSNDLRVLQSSAAGIPMFRTVFNVAKTIKSAKIYSSGLGVYDLFINAKRVGTLMPDGTTLYDELKPTWTDYSKTIFYSTYDVTHLLSSGQNAIGAIVSSGWLTGYVAHGEYGSPDLGFIAKLLITYTDGTSESIVTNPSSWKSSMNSAIRLGNIYDGESYDARKESNWTSASFDDAEWTATSVNPFFKGNITAFVGPTVQVRPHLEQKAKTITIHDGITATGTTYGKINIIKTIQGESSVTLKKGETATYDFGQNIVGWVRFKVKGVSGNKMRVRFAEMLNDSGASSRGNDNAQGTLYLANLRSAKATLYYTLKGDVAGETFHPSMTFFGFRYCEVTASEDMVIETMKGEVVGTATAETSSIKTSHSAVNQLISNSMWGQRGNFVSIPTDCPQRDERLGWTGDTQVFSRAAAYNADVAGFFQKWMGDMRDSQHANGAYPDVAPHAWVSYGASGWAEAGIIIPFHMYIMYGDKAIIEDNYASMEKYMGFLAAQTGDGYQYQGANTSYGDWLAYDETDKRYISVAYYAYATRLMEKMSKAASKTSTDVYAQNATKYGNLFNNIKAEFQTRYVNSDGTLKQTTQTAYLLALKLDLFPTKAAKDQAVTYLVQKIANNGNKLSTGFLGTATLNHTLSEIGETGTAYNLLLQRNDPSWLYSVDQGATTIWERWNSYTIANGFGDPGMNSFNHYSYGAVTEWMYRYMAGIEIDEMNPGFKHIILQPNPDTRTVRPAGQDKITMVDANYGSYYGPIKSAWTQNEDGSTTYSISVPANTTATLKLPRLKTTDHVYENTTAAEKVEGVSGFTKEAKLFVMELKSGNYTFIVKKKR